VKPEFLRWGKFKLGNGSLIRFWEDTWLGNEPLKNQYPALYNIVRKKSVLVSSVLSSIPLNVFFRRSLVANNLLSWHQLVARVMDIQLQDQSDSFVWSLQQNGLFSVRSMYRAITITNIIPHNHIIWKLKLPLKIKIFMWYLIKGVTLTKDNLARRRWKGSLNCCCCSLIETIQHLFFDCQNAKFLWRLISVVFNLPMPLNVNHMFTHWLNGLRKLRKHQALVGACAILWAIWLTRNDITFNCAQVSSSL